MILLRLGVSPGGHQWSAGAVLSAVVLKASLCPELGETGWFDLGNRTVQFGGRCELVLASVLVSSFSSGTLFYSAATSLGPFSMSGFALSLLVEASHLGPV
jgi:hypothetical protein